MIVFSAAETNKNVADLQICSKEFIPKICHDIALK